MEDDNLFDIDNPDISGQDGGYESEDSFEDFGGEISDHERLREDDDDDSWNPLYKHKPPTEEDFVPNILGIEDDDDDITEYPDDLTEFPMLPPPRLLEDLFTGDGTMFNIIDESITCYAENSSQGNSNLIIPPPPPPLNTNDDGINVNLDSNEMKETEILGTEFSLENSKLGKHPRSHELDEEGKKRMCFWPHANRETFSEVNGGRDLSMGLFFNQPPPEGVVLNQGVDDIKILSRINDDGSQIRSQRTTTVTKIRRRRRGRRNMKPKEEKILPPPVAAPAPLRKRKKKKKKKKKKKVTRKKNQKRNNDDNNKEKEDKEYIRLPDYTCPKDGKKYVLIRNDVIVRTMVEDLGYNKCDDEDDEHYVVCGGSRTNVGINVFCRRLTLTMGVDFIIAKEKRGKKRTTIDGERELKIYRLFFFGSLIEKFMINNTVESVYQRKSFTMKLLYVRTLTKYSKMNDIDVFNFDGDENNHCSFEEEIVKCEFGKDNLNLDLRLDLLNHGTRNNVEFIICVFKVSEKLIVAYSIPFKKEGADQREPTHIARICDVFWKRLE